MFRFADPYVLLLLAFLPVLVVYRKQKVKMPTLRVSGIAAIVHVPPSPFIRFAGGMLSLFKFTALVLMVLALARPQWGTRVVNVKTEGINILLAVDISESMGALDFEMKGNIVNRLEAVKNVIHRFVAKRSGDRIGMVVFGSNAYTQLPLTRDYNTLATILDRVQIGAAGKSTAIGDAIGISLKRLADIPGKSNIMILLTDGRSNSGELTPETAVEIAVAKGVRIYTIGVGREGEAPFRVNIPGYGERYVYQRVDIDENTLRMIAEKTNGAYFRAEDTKGLETIYDTIDRLEKTEATVKTYDSFRELYRYLLFPAFCFLAGWMVLTHTRFLRIP
ncbi:MAG: VWA domain-containing protein [Desulfobacterales bacterium]|jgi:Ca-activated chloride channel family protein|nr:VWA domain-containing protein [Desulfobacterales bacterium]